MGKISNLLLLLGIRLQTVNWNTSLYMSMYNEWKKMKFQVCGKCIRRSLILLCVHYRKYFEKTGQKEEIKIPNRSIIQRLGY